jgi:hypothetical protein
MDIIGLDLHKRESQLSIKAEDGTITGLPSYRSEYLGVASVRHRRSGSVGRGRVVNKVAAVQCRAAPLSLELTQTTTPLPQSSVDDRVTPRRYPPGDFIRSTPWARCSGTFRCGHRANCR